jgi:hypothetical protein
MTRLQTAHPLVVRHACGLTANGRMTPWRLARCSAVSSLSILPGGGRHHVRALDRSMTYRPELT